MVPRGSCCINRPRSAMMARASSSENTPAKQAATNSPTLCPIIASGETPHLIHIRAKAYSITNRAGWASRVSTQARAASPA